MTVINDCKISGSSKSQKGFLDVPSIHDGLKAQVSDAPLEAGCYIMRDGDGKILYVGKARILRNRLKSYFSVEKEPKTDALMRHVRSIETIIVSNEYEALLLECTLIKQHRPKYNIDLKDGKTYPVVRVTNEEFPKVFRTRRIIEDGSKYFGPFPNAHVVDATLELLLKIYPVRKCRNLRKRENPCIYFHINRCKAPCCGKINAAEYNEQVEKIASLLSGDVESFIADVRIKMQCAARELQFEKAAEMRDSLEAVQGLLVDNVSDVTDHDASGRDYISYASDSSLITFSVFSMRDGKLAGRQLFRSHSAAEYDESAETFLLSFYHGGNPPPACIYLPKFDWTNVQIWFLNTFGRAPELLSPESKHDMAILNMAHQNAEEDLRLRVKERGGGPAMEELMKVLNLNVLPERIEGFDIAQLDGKHSVASLISFVNGIPDKKNYRLFKLRSVEGIIDDFAAMREAVKRRYTRLLAENARGLSELPDLIMVDGGIGQVNAAEGVLNEIGFNCPVVGLAKRNEELWLPYASSPIIIPQRSDALKLLQAVRDETHRFATKANQNMRSKTLSLETLESIEGVGRARAAKIIKAAKNLQNVIVLPAPVLAEKAGISLTLAERVRRELSITLNERDNIKERLTRRNSRARQFEKKMDNLVNEALDKAALGTAAFAAETEMQWGAK
jgi:excinuclease ABC subunit C